MDGVVSRPVVESSSEVGDIDADTARERTVFQASGTRIGLDEPAFD